MDSHGPELETFSLRTPNRLTYAHIGKVLDQLEPLNKAGDQALQQQLDLDMRSTVFCSPTGITILAACLERLWQEGKFASGTIRAPKNPLLRQYLQRMDFFEELSIKLDEDFTRQDPVGFRPVTHVESERDCPVVARDLVAAVAERNSIDGSTEAALKTCFSELVENVFYHAESSIDALVAIQAYKSKKRTELVILDGGRGIRPALEEIPDYREVITDDASAIMLALEKNVTTTGDERRGIGLWVAAEVVRRNKGQMLIVSNEGAVEINAEEARPHDAYFWPGTLVVIEFRMDQPIDTKAVYDSEEWLPLPDDEPDFAF